MWTEREVEQGFVDFDQLGLPPTSGKVSISSYPHASLVFALIFYGRSLADPFSRLCRLTPPFASGRPVRGFLGGDFKFQGGERLWPSLYLQIEAPVKHKHYRPAGKKKEGNAARYVTSLQTVKQLQVSLPLFRKLCILKGVFPREPKKKVKGSHHTYYHLKDVSFIQHEPLVERLGEIRAYERKVKKADAKKNKERAALLKERRPAYKLDRIILQRYPKFVDALRDTLTHCLQVN